MKNILAAGAFAFLFFCAFAPKPDLDEGVVAIYHDSTLCTGFVIDAKRHLIMTADHCVMGNMTTPLWVKLRNEQRFSATIVGRSKERDLAIIEVPDHAVLQELKIGDSDKVKVGDEVLSIGHPHGSMWEHRTGPVLEVYPDTINSVGTIDHGNSGGPLFNADGEVIGVNDACINIFGGPCMIGISISSNDMKAVIRLIGQKQ